MCKSSFARLLASLLALGLPMVADSLTGKVVDPQGAVVANAELRVLDQSSGDAA